MADARRPNWDLTNINAKGEISKSVSTMSEDFLLHLAPDEVENEQALYEQVQPLIVAAIVKYHLDRELFNQPLKPANLLRQLTPLKTAADKMLTNLSSLHPETWRHLCDKDNGQFPVKYEYVPADGQNKTLPNTSYPDVRTQLEWGLHLISESAARVIARLEAEIENIPVPGRPILFTFSSGFIRACETAFNAFKCAEAGFDEQNPTNHKALVTYKKIDLLGFIKLCLIVAEDFRVSDDDILQHLPESDLITISCK